MDVSDTDPFRGYLKYIDYDTNNEEAICGKPTCQILPLSGKSTSKAMAINRVIRQ